MKSEKESLLKSILWALVIVLLVAVVIGAKAFFVRSKQEENIRITASSFLTESIDIAQLSTAEFKYKGIAEVYEDEERTKVKCRVCYDSLVKAGIDMEKVKIDPDLDRNALIITLPEIDINVTIVDEKTMAVLPKGSDVEINMLLKVSREDAEREASESTDLINVATENVKATIEGLMYPVLKANGYTIIWK